MQKQVQPRVIDFPNIPRGIWVSKVTPSYIHFVQRTHKASFRLTSHALFVGRGVFDRLKDHERNPPYRIAFTVPLITAVFLEMNALTGLSPSRTRTVLIVVAFSYFLLGAFYLIHWLRYENWPSSSRLSKPISFRTTKKLQTDDLSYRILKANFLSSSLGFTRLAFSRLLLLEEHEINFYNWLFLRLFLRSSNQHCHLDSTCLNKSLLSFLQVQCCNRPSL